MKRGKPRDTQPPKRIGRRATKEETRDALIASGMELFARHGLDGPSLDDICEHAGLTRGAFYVHFTDRDDFLVAVMDRVGRPLLDEMFAASSATETPRAAAQDGGRFAAATQRFVEASASGRYPLMPEGGIRPYQLLDACARAPVIRERYVSLVKLAMTRAASLVEDGKKEGALRDDIDAESAGTLAIALIVGLQTLADLGMPTKLETLAPAVVGLLRTTRSS